MYQAQTQQQQQQQQTPTRKACRNIAIYGHCKYEHEGCPFDHTKPTKAPAALSARNVAAPVFVPKVTKPVEEPGRAYNPYEHVYAPEMAVVPARQPPQYHLYAAPLPHVSNLHPHHLATNAFFMPPKLREELQRKQEAMNAAGGMVEEVHVYHSLVPLEPGAAGPGLVDGGVSGQSGDHSRVFGYRSQCYKATCTLDGKRYVLRRLEDFWLQQEAAIGVVEKWRRVRHAGIVSVREAFTTRTFGDSSIVFVYDYHPLANTLWGEHMTVGQGRVGERTLWSYVCQLGSALRCVHSSGLAARCVEASKVLVTGRNRVRLNCCGVVDVLAFEAEESLEVLQAEDLAALGRLIVAVGTGMDGDMASFAARYSAELAGVVEWLMEGGATAGALLERLALRLVDEMDAGLGHADLLEDALLKEVENGRLVRLLCRLGYARDDALALFRDYLFATVDLDGRRVMDLSHVISALNKVDAGSAERLVLMGRDTCVVVSYRELKNLALQ